MHPSWWHYDANSQAPPTPRLLHKTGKAPPRLSYSRAGQAGTEDPCRDDVVEPHFLLHPPTAGLHTPRNGSTSARCLKYCTFVGPISLLQMAVLIFVLHTGQTLCGYQRCACHALVRHGEHVADDVHSIKAYISAADHLMRISACCTKIKWCKSLPCCSFLILRMHAN